MYCTRFWSPIVKAKSKRFLVLESWQWWQCYNSQIIVALVITNILSKWAWRWNFNLWRKLTNVLYMRYVVHFEMFCKKLCYSYVYYV